MSFLNTNNSEFLTVRITKKGRNAISKGNFVISYFQVGDSEYDYTHPFDKLTGAGGSPSQKVFSPMDKESGVKYPYKIDSTSGVTTYGNPIQQAYTDTLRNVMGPAGFVTDYIPYQTTGTGFTGTTVMCVTSTLNFTGLTGTNTLTVPTGNTYQNCEFITLVFNTFDNTNPNDPLIKSGRTNSLVYKVTGITGNTLYLDRKTPTLSGVTGTAEIVGNKCSIEFPIITGTTCPPPSCDPYDQHDPWTLDIVWGENPIGYTGATENNLTGFTGNQFVSTKQFLGYTTSSGQSVNSGTTYTNSYDEVIYVTPEEQRVLAIIHYSELGDIVNDPERFFKYDDYISTNDVIGDSIVDDRSGNTITDTEYFEIYIPFILYHRNTGTTIGATFHMDTVNQLVETPTTISDGRSELAFRYLLDEQNNRVGRVYYNNKTIVFDDQELVAILDYRSNRKHTLGSPKTFLVHSDNTLVNSLVSGVTDQKFWITYIFTNSGTTLNSLPCNYYTSITSVGSSSNDCHPNVPSNIGIKFDIGTFQFMETTLSGFTKGFLGTGFKVLVQETTMTGYPSTDLWREIDYTTQASGNGISYLNRTNIEDKTFIITKSGYTGASLFNLDTYMGNGYIVQEPSTKPKFGDEQPFPGSIKLIRSTDIEVMDFLINLPSTQFTVTQNPTYTIGDTKKITEIALLNNNKEVYAVGKTASPLTRSGTQVFALKLDF